MHSQNIQCNKSFILRVRNEESDEKKQPRWRYVLLDSDGESRRGFTSLDQLFKILVMEITGDLPNEFTESQIADRPQCGMRPL